MSEGISGPGTGELQLGGPASGGGVLALPAMPAPVVASGHRHRDWLARRALLAADVLAVVSALAVAIMLTSDRHTAGLETLVSILVILPAWVVLLKAYGLYERDIKRISNSALDDLPWLFHAYVIGGIGVWIFFELMPPQKLLFTEVLVFAVLGITLSLLLRPLARMLVARRLGPERVLFLGTGDSAELLERKLRSHPRYNLQPVGFATTHGSARQLAPDEAPPRTYERLGDLPRLLELHNVDRLVVSHEGLEQEGIVDVLRLCKGLGVKVSVLPHLFDVMGPSVELDAIEGVTVLGINPPVLSPSSRVVKRATDLVGAVVALLLASPVLLAIAVAIKASSPGGVFFRQERIGRGGRRFRVVKFRTMVPDAESRRAELLSGSKDPNWLHLDHDPRVTWVGRLLRRTSLDELPQLWNVVRGEMSLVGPRPLPLEEDANIQGWGRNRLDLTPGITGYWQVLGRTEIPFDEMVKLDYTYVTNWSLWGDIRLILLTLPAVLRRRGAN